MKSQNAQKNKVIIVGAGLAGLTAARQILYSNLDIEVEILQALDRVGGRTYSIQIKDTVFDLGAQYIGKTQKYAIQLAQQAGCQFQAQFHQGIKILDFQKQPSSYRSDIPNNISWIGLIQMQWTITKLNLMAKKVPKEDPSKCEMAANWDSMTVGFWLNQNVRNKKVKKLFQICIRTVCAVQLSQISVLLFLWYITQNGGVQNLIGIQNGLQEKKLKNGTQDMSKYLAKKVQQKNGKIFYKKYVKKIINQANYVKVYTENGQKYQGNYLIIAIPPNQVQKMQFSPKLSIDRKYLCNKSFMGLTTKVILLYDKRYWVENGFSGQILSDCYSSPILCAYDDTRQNSKGQYQPAIFTFVNGLIYKQWTTRNDIQTIILQHLAKYFKCKQMLKPLAVKWFAWDQQPSIGGGYTCVYSPGTFVNMKSFCIRNPQGRIHWAGTQTALVSTGYMDGAIQSGKRVSNEILQILSKNKSQVQIQDKKKMIQVKIQGDKKNWYNKLLRGPWKLFQWF